MEKIVPINEGGETKIATIDKDTVLVDLDATYANLESEEKDNILIDGLEQYVREGILSYKALKLTNSKSKLIEPGTSKLNAVYGGEGFIESLTKGFVEFIKKCMKYIKIFIDWSMNNIRVLLGFRKTSERVKAAKEAREDVFNMIESILEKLGMPNDICSLRKVLEKSPEDANRLETLRVLHTGISNEKEGLQRLAAVTEPLYQLQILLSKSHSELSKLRMEVTKEIKLVKQKFTNNNVAQSDLIKLEKLFLEANATVINRDVVVDKIKYVLSLLSNVKFNNVEGFSTFVTNLHDALKQQEKFINLKMDRDRTINLHDAIMANSDGLSKCIDNNLAFAKINIGDVKDFISLEESLFISELSTRISYPALFSAYNSFVKDIRDFSSIFESVTTLSKNISGQIDTFLRWRDKCDAVVCILLTNDINKIKEMILKLKDEENIDLLNGVNWKVVEPNYNYIKEYFVEIAKGLMEANKLDKALIKFCNIIGVNIRGGR